MNNFRVNIFKTTETSTCEVVKTQKLLQVQKSLVAKPQPNKRWIPDPNSGSSYCDEKQRNCVLFTALRALQLTTKYLFSKLMWQTNLNTTVKNIYVRHFCGVYDIYASWQQFLYLKLNTYRLTNWSWNNRNN